MTKITLRLISEGPKLERKNKDGLESDHSSFDSEVGLQIRGLLAYLVSVDAVPDANDCQEEKLVVFDASWERG